MKETLEFILYTLAVWRISSLFANEEGPFDMFSRIRSLVGIYYDEISNPHGSNTFAKGLICVWCNSVWFSAILSAFVSDTFMLWVIHTLSISSAVILFDVVIDRLMMQDKNG